MTPSRPAQLILRPTSTEAVALECWEMMRKVKAPWGLGRWVVGAGGAVCVCVRERVAGGAGDALDGGGPSSLLVARRAFPVWGFPPGPPGSSLLPNLGF